MTYSLDFSMNILINLPVWQISCLVLQRYIHKRMVYLYKVISLVSSSDSFNNLTLVFINVFAGLQLFILNFFRMFYAYFFWYCKAPWFVFTILFLRSRPNFQNLLLCIFIVCLLGNLSFFFFVTTYCCQGGKNRPDMAIIHVLCLFFARRPRF